MNPRRFLPALALLFVGSGCAALMYEIVWFQLLQLVIGSSAISLGILLGTFMGGMCLGSLLLSRMVSARRHPLRVYAALELGIGLMAVLILFGMPLVGGIYTAWAGEGVLGIVLRGVAAGVCLLPPTMLMGATLPAISRWVKATPEGVSWLGFFYGGNIAGGVAGCILAGFVPPARLRHRRSRPTWAWPSIWSVALGRVHAGGAHRLRGRRRAGGACARLGERGARVSSRSRSRA